MNGRTLIETMNREMRLRMGPVPQALGAQAVPPGKHLLQGDEFLLREPDFAVHYRRGGGITMERTGPEDAGEEELFLNGTVYAAVACLNGLMPLHASAVAMNGRVVAFTGPAGAGKSTVTAGLSSLGLPLFCDDTLLVHVNDDGALTCLPGHKRMKLWPDSVELTGSAALDEVSASYGKYYVTPAGGDVTEPLPLGALIFLEPAAMGEPRLVPLTGGAKIARLDDDHYTRALFDKTSTHDRAARFVFHAQIAARLPMACFVRQMDREQFWATTRYLAENLSVMDLA